jgi:hypothetical protein
MTTLDTALLVARRWPVFPCREDKRPATPNGFKNATRDPVGVVDLWRAHPGPLIGVPTGAVSGFDVLDIDPRHDGDKWLAEADPLLPNTRKSATRSGGTHLFFAHADGLKNSASKIARGVDVRAEGGYVILWGAHGCSVEHAGLLHSWPRWVLDILMPKPKPRMSAAPATKIEGDTRAVLMIERAKDRVRRAAPGQRHINLRAAAATLGGLIKYIPGGEDGIRRELVDLAMQAGGEDRENAEKTASWAMEKGKGSPLLCGR